MDCALKVSRSHFGRPYLLRLLSALSAILILGANGAQGEELFSRPSGFWVTASAGAGGGLPRLYGPTNQSANWTVAQWNIPQDLPAFQAGITENQFAKVKISAGGGYELAQYSSGAACKKSYPSGRFLVNEFDLFVQPVQRKIDGYPTPAMRPSLPISKYDNLELSLSATINAVTLSDAACEVTQISALVAIIFSNRLSKQFLSYQLHLNTWRAEDGQLLVRPARPSWFFTGLNTQLGISGKYGFDDVLQSYGLPASKQNVPNAYRFDILPRIRDVIVDGAAKGLDQDLSHWKVSGTYHGVASWGHVRVSTNWSGFAVSARPSP